MNVTETEIKHYLEVFYKTLFEEARSKLEPDTTSRLRHVAVLPAKITVHVSTKFGIALNYEPLPNTASSTKVEIETVRGSTRAENLLFETPASLILTPRNWPFAVNGA